MVPVALGLLLWLLVSVPVAVLVGRMIAYGARGDDLPRRLPGESFTD